MSEGYEVPTELSGSTGFAGTSNEHDVKNEGEENTQKWSDRVNSVISGRSPPLHCVCVCVFSSHPFWTSSSLDVPAGVTQEDTGFLIHLPSAVRALIFVARRIQPFLSLVDREVEFCVLTN